MEQHFPRIPENKAPLSLLLLKFNKVKEKEYGQETNKS